jgi:hypothetical protein
MSNILFGFDKKSKMTISEIDLVCGWVVTPDIIKYLMPSASDMDDDHVFDHLCRLEGEIKFEQDPQLAGHGIMLLKIPHDQQTTETSSWFIGLRGKAIYSDSRGHKLPFVSLDSYYPTKQLEQLEGFQQLAVGTKFYPYIVDLPEVFIRQNDCSCCS